MAVRLHRPAESPRANDEPAPLPAAAAAPSAAAAPAVSLQPPKTLSLDFRTPRSGVKAQRRRAWMRIARFAIPGACAAAFALWLGLAPRAPKERLLAGSVVEVRQTISATVGGVLQSLPAPGTAVDAGITIMEIVVPAVLPAPSADVAKREEQLRTAELALVNARREQVRVENLFKAERATRWEREDAGRAARLAAEDRNEAAAALESAQAAGPVAPVPAPVTLRAEHASRVREVLRPVGASVKAGEAVVVLVPVIARVEARAEGDAVPNRGEIANVEVAGKTWPGRVVESTGGRVVVEFDPAGDLTDGTPATIRFAAAR